MTDNQLIFWYYRCQAALLLLDAAVTVTANLWRREWPLPGARNQFKSGIFEIFSCPLGSHGLIFQGLDDRQPAYFLVLPLPSSTFVTRCRCHCCCSSWPPWVTFCYGPQISPNLGFLRHSLALLDFMGFHCSDRQPTGCLFKWQKNYSSNPWSMSQSNLPESIAHDLEDWFDLLIKK